MTQIEGSWRLRHAVRAQQIAEKWHEATLSPRPDRTYPNACEQLATHFSQQETVPVWKGGKRIASTPGVYLAKLIRHAPLNFMGKVFMMRRVLRACYYAGKPIVLRIHHSDLVYLEKAFEGRRLDEAAK